MVADSSFLAGNFQLQEIDEVGRPTKSYVVSKAGNEDRMDQTADLQPALTLSRILSVFLPSGYPYSVTTDYAAYQFFDSLQAFASSIAGLLASRAVLQGIGVGDENATATAAMLLSILQESMGRCATIFFAHWASRRIEADCKKYRLLADIFNDASFIMDCLSPSLPKGLRVPLLCASTVSRAICGVAGGSSKAVLSAHFAKADNLGELNAKDSSQETVISLLGIWAGGAVVSSVHDPVAVWTWLLFLLSVHLALNYAAVRSVTLRTLNCQRACLVLSSLLKDGKVLTPEDVSKRESIFETECTLRWCDGMALGRCRLGVPVQDLVGSLRASLETSDNTPDSPSALLRQLLHLFRQEPYVLWRGRNQECVIILYEHATGETKLRAWCHALRMSALWRSEIGKSRFGINGQLALLEESLEANNKYFGQYLDDLRTAGWSLSTIALENLTGTRLRTLEQTHT